MKTQSRSTIKRSRRTSFAAAGLAVLMALALSLPANARITLEDLQAQIDALQARIAALEQPNGNSKTVFVSSVNYSGDLGGPLGADQKCNGLAAAAGLSGTYMAWLGDSNTDPVRRFRRSNNSYLLTNGNPIATDWADLTDGSITNSIFYTETGAARTIPSHMVWTNAYTDGDTWNANDCANWTSTTGTGMLGNSGATGSSWAIASSATCSALHRIYCFEQ